VPQTIWLREEVSDNQDAKREAKALNSEAIFETPKPEKLLKRIIEIASASGEFILDSFSGSGTTGAVAHKLGRRHISVEMGDHAQTHIVPRYKKVIEGEQGGISTVVGWQGGGGFRYCTLGAPLFDADGNVNEAVSFRDLAAHVFFCETGSPIPRRAASTTPFIGAFQGRAVYLLYNRDCAGVASARAGNVLNLATLDELPWPQDFQGPRVVYAEGCTLSAGRLAKAGVTFKHIPYQIGGV
jgi:adenine-specific DNA-methyltransferase